MTDMMILKDLLVGVTGITGHLGRQLAADLLKHGARVAGCARTQTRLDDLAKSLNCGADRLFLKSCDATIMTGTNGLTQFVDAAAAHFNTPFDGWVNNAYTGKSEKLGELTETGVDTTLHGALTGYLMATELIAKHFINAKRKGSIVNVSSMYGVVSPQPSAYVKHPQFHNPPAYGAAKAGVIQFSKYAATHYAPHGIRVNVIVPGAFPSDAVQKEQGFIGELTKRIPLERIGMPTEYAGPVVFLLSDLASYVTGAELRVDGGWTAW